MKKKLQCPIHDPMLSNPKKCWTCLIASFENALKVEENNICAKKEMEKLNDYQKDRYVLIDLMRALIAVDKRIIWELYNQNNWPMNEVEIAGMITKINDFIVDNKEIFQ